MEPHIVSKGEFAALCGVSKGRVSQWLDEGKLDAASLVGVGRSARIDVAKAKAQIAARTDPGQRFGNGLLTNLIAAPAPPPSAPSRPDPVDPTPRDLIDERIKQAKLAEVEFRNRKAAEEERARSGRYVEAAESRRTVTKLVGEVLKQFEGSLGDMATSLAGRFALPERDVLHALRLEFTGVRTRAAQSLRREAGTLPDIVLDEVEDAETEPA